MDLKKRQKPNISELHYSQEGDLKLLVDYLSFRLPYDFPFDDIFNQVLSVPKSNFKFNEDSTFNGYNCVYQYGHMKVCTDGLADAYGNINYKMGHYITMSGQGCRELELFIGDTWEQLFEIVHNLGGNFTRLDVAIDDFYGFFEVNDLIQKVKNDECVSRFRYANIFTKYQIEGGESEGASLYCGSETAETRLLFYEKNFEQELQIPIWNRTELKLKKKRANAFIESLLQKDKSIGEKTAEYINQYIRFIDKKDSDSNKRRSPISEWWTSFIGTSERLELSMKKPDRNIDTISNYLYHSVSRNLALFNAVFPEELETLIGSGTDKLKEEDIEIIESVMESEKQFEEFIHYKEQEVMENLLERKKMWNGLKKDLAKLTKIKENPHLDKSED